MEKIFRKFAHKTSELVGSPYAFLVSISLILAWLITGPLFGFSDTWQLLINTVTTIITFLMVFLIQNTQNRDTKMINIKIDELIKSIKDANTKLLDLDDLSDTQLTKLEESFKKIAHKKRK
ncbi:MAG: hypothetical protein KatS3mg086_131 [Candidatus Dojkabacteria bacterium]|nr:MAG: hypothetical protein KatS3mg086_131 [Candidatus Dojkabacteria bacterium]